MRSMTGFGEAVANNDRYRVAARVRTVNHRHLELAIRLDEVAAAAEPAVRALVAARLARGRVEVAVGARPLEPPALRLALNEELARALRHAAGRLEAEEAGLGAATVGDLLRLPGAYQVVPEEGLWRSEDGALVGEAVGRALDAVVAARAREGEALAAAMQERLAELRRLVARLGERRGAVREELAARLGERLAELLGEVPVDEQRLAQEAAILVERSDVAEELDRLEAHCAHFEELLATDEPAGRRLDFLAQEMGREAGTVAAKCRDSAMIRASLEMRHLIEQLREQIQNVE